VKLLNFTIIKLTLCFIIGVLASHFLNVSLLPSLSLTIVLVISLGIYNVFLKKSFKRDLGFGVLTFLSTISLGIMVYNIHYQPNFPKHYTRQLYFDKSSSKRLSFKILKILKPSTFHNKYLVKLIRMDDKAVKGKLLLNVARDSTTPSYHVDDIFVANTLLHPIPPPNNPGQFDYKSYLEKQYIYHQIFLEDYESLKIDSTTHTIFGLAANLRQHINHKLQQYNFKSSELAIINALLLGQRQDIDRDTYNNYVNAGAIHILAVSGLHVGVLMLLLQALLFPLLYLKHGKVIRMILIVVLLWCFAFIAGLSASVTRAVTMFSLVVIAINLKRRTNIYNTIASSIFLLLLFKPMFLFDVGFQLSYTAVLSIISIQPMLYKFWKPSNKIAHFFWSIFTVTLAAQFGVAPIGLYYFHQFPGLFFISNLAIIPVLGIILGLGILVIVLALCNLLPDVLASGYGGIIYYMNRLVEWVSNHEAFIFKDISLSLFQLITCYFLIFSLVQYLNHKTYRTVLMVLFGIIGIQMSYFYNTFNNKGDALIIFNRNRHTIIGQKQNRTLILHHDLDSISYSTSSFLKDYKTNHFINKIEEDSLRLIYEINNKFMLVVDNLGIYNTKSAPIDFVLLRQSPRINLNRLIDSLKPNIIIADGSNYMSYVERWKQTCLKRKLRFHHTAKNGAFIVE